MSSLDRPPVSWPERVERELRTMTRGGFKGALNAQPVPRRRDPMRVAQVGSVGGGESLFRRDRFVLAAATGTHTLTHVPLADSEHVYLNGVQQDEGTDWTRAGQTLSVLAAMGAVAGDVLDVRYAYSTGTASAVVPFSSTGWRYLQVALADSTDRSAPAFDDTAWAAGTAPFGDVAGGAHLFYGDVPVTDWDVNTGIWARRTVAAGFSSYEISVRYDNTVSVYWDGVLVTSGVTVGELLTAWVAGDGASSVLAIHAKDDAAVTVGDRTFLDVQVRGYR